MKFFWNKQNNFDQGGKIGRSKAGKGGWATEFEFMKVVESY